MKPRLLAWLVVLALMAFTPAGHAQDETRLEPALARDLSGVWLVKEAGATFSRTPPPAMTEWAEAKFRANKATIGPTAALDANDPTVECFPPGVPYVLLVPVPFEFVQTADRIIQLFEYNHNVRRIYTDGRPQPPDLQTTERAQWMGYSTGRWEGNVFVIDTTGFNDRTWLDRAGHPHSSALHVIERIRRVDRGTLAYDVTIVDPQAYVGPWSGTLLFTLQPDWEILEHNCLPEGEEYLRFRQRAWKDISHTEREP